MITLYKVKYLILWMALTGFLLVKTSFGQTAVTTQPAADQALSATLQAFQQEQQVLAQSFSEMMAQGGTPQQMAAWQQQNAAALAAQQQLAQQMAAASAAQPMPIASEVFIPAAATPEMETFLTNQATLANNFAQLHNQNSTTDPTSLFQQQNSALLQTQAQLSQTLATQASQQPVPVPPPLVLPPNTTPQMAAFLTARDQLMREQIQLQNQYVNATPSVRNAAMQQWQETNAVRFQQLQTLAQNMSSSSSN